MTARVSTQAVDSVLVLSAGLLAFLAIAGGGILHPTHTTWLMNGDPTTQWLGWEFFRHTPLVQWPVGANARYGLEVGSSIVFTDSIPLLALLLKPLGPWLPQPFQYLGAWIAACFVLQAWFAHTLLSQFTQQRWLTLIGCGFFLIAPPFIWRLHQHYALFAHWIILAALTLYFSKSFRSRYWLTLLLVAVLVHAFLFVMAGAVWTADLVQRKWRKEISTPYALLHVTVAVGLVLLSMWAAGYFMLRGEVGAFGFGYYRMNLLSLIDAGEVWASQPWSKVLRDQPQTQGDYEGFNFLGLGILCLGILATVELAKLRWAALKFSTCVPLSCIALGLFLFALSNRVAYGAQEVFVLELPTAIHNLASSFRSSGRMFWPVYYLIYCSIFFLLARHSRHVYVLAITALLLAVQISDSGPALTGFRQRFIDANWQSPLAAPQWAEFAKRYQRIVYVLPQATPPRWMELTHFAAMHQMTINSGYFARIDMKIVEQQRSLITQAVQARKFESDTLYVFDDGALWNAASTQPAPSDLVTELNGVRVLAPGFLSKP